MKISGGERDGGEGQNFVAREKTIDEMRSEHTQQKVELEMTRAERVQNREVDQAKVDQQLDSLRRLGKGKTNEQVDQILGNTDVAGQPEMLAAYKLWEHERAQAAVEAAFEDGTDELAARREAKQAEGSGEESAA